MYITVTWSHIVGSKDDCLNEIAAKGFHVYDQGSSWMVIIDETDSVKAVRLWTELAEVHQKHGAAYIRSYTKGKTTSGSVEALFAEVVSDFSRLVHHAQDTSARLRGSMRVRNALIISSIIGNIRMDLERAIRVKLTSILDLHLLQPDTPVPTK